MREDMAFDPQESAFIVLNKQKGFSSNSELGYLKRHLKIRKAGFCGTLDPLAEGVLIIAIGKATKLISLATQFDKAYTGKMVLGFRSDSLDCGTELVPTGLQPKDIPLEEVERHFSGTISQVPPVYSALKVNGMRAYQLVREGEIPEMKPRDVVIKSLKLTKISGNELAFEVRCSKGTYIRSLVGDIGEFLGCGAVVTELRRTEVGPFRIENSVSLEDIKQDPENISKAVVEVADFLSDRNCVEVTPAEFKYLENGNDIAKLGLNLVEGLNLVKVEGRVSLIISRTNDKYSYFAFV